MSICVIKNVKVVVSMNGKWKFPFSSQASRGKKREDRGWTFLVMSICLVISFSVSSPSPQHNDSQTFGHKDH